LKSLKEDSLYEELVIKDLQGNDGGAKGTEVLIRLPFLSLF